MRAWTMMMAATVAVATPVAGNAKAKPAMPASTYLMKAGASDLYEIESSKLVTDTANPKLRDFAQMMVSDHTKSTADVKAAAIQAGLHPAPPKLSPQQARDIAALRRAADGAARDTLYVKQQKAAHAAALTLQQGYAGHGGAPALRKTAAQIVPVVKHHITLLAAM